jgi:poly(hydroxyalkanoate) granule-associated protein
MAAKSRSTQRKTAARTATPLRRFAALQTHARKAIESSTREVLARAVEARNAVLTRAAGARELVETAASDARARTAKAATRFERAFEQRISTVVAKLGVPTAKDVRSLSRQVAELQASVNQLRRSRARA